MAIVEFVSRFLHQYVVVCVALAIIPAQIPHGPPFQG
jgi:hypothetical protein